jgi:EAL domain-containing protein (putative c-di-GMP-specific phosphodiesterase class I)
MKKVTYSLGRHKVRETSVEAFEASPDFATASYAKYTFTCQHAMPVFTVPPNLQILIVDKCVWLTTFPTLPATITNVHMGGCSIRDIPDLSHLTRLELLDMTGNAIRRLDDVRWPPTLRTLNLSFNISPTQLEDPSLVSRIMHQLELHSMVANQLTLELTERGILEGSAIVRDNLRQLREQGICLSLDDFGTGYSSLSLLGQLQPDEVKIDRSFVMGMETDPYALQIITLLARMAPELGFQLVAEGVEDRASFERLRQLGITRFQGYWFARPMACAAVDSAAALPAAA